MQLKDILTEAQSLSLQEQIQLATQLLQLVEKKMNQFSIKEIQRKPGLHTGAFIIADDFDEPLPDTFWLGES